MSSLQYFGPESVGSCTSRDINNINTFTLTELTDEHNTDIHIKHVSRMTSAEHFINHA